MNPKQRYYARMVNLCATLFALLAAALAYNLAFDWLSTLIFVVLAVPNIYFYLLYLSREIRIERDCRFLTNYMRRNQQWQQWPNA